MRNPDEALIEGLQLQMANVVEETKRVEAYLRYLRAERGRLIERLVEARKQSGETR